MDLDQQNLKSYEIQDDEFEKLRVEAVEKFEKAALHQSGKLTSPFSLKEPGPRESPLQCLIHRDKKTGIFHLYLALTPSFTDKGKFLLAARRYKSGTHIEYIISTDANDLSKGSKGYVGKLRSTDFLRANYTIYDSQPPNDKAKAITSRASRRVGNKKISPEVPSCNFEVGHVSYKFNLRKNRCPRRMVCSLTFPILDDKDVNLKRPESTFNQGYIGLKNKPPRWHEKLEFWCLNFHGRVTISSVKNFQLLANVDQSQPGGKGDDKETVLLQFGKVGDDTFIMDYRHPLSAFQAFAICLTTFGTKLGCE